MTGPLATDLFDYDLPSRLIAQTPAARRDESRLLVVDRATRTLAHRQFSNLPEYLRPGDTLFRNNAAVLPARLLARRPTGGQVECFLLRPLEAEPTSPPSATRPPPSDPSSALRPPSSGLWRCLVKPGRRLSVGAGFADPGGAFSGVILAKEPDGSAIVRFTVRGEGSIVDVANRLGEVPLPPYIERRVEATDHDAVREKDLARYQTVYADRARQVAVAAPTAGLHFTPELLARLATDGVRTADVTLHVGLGTFQPISTDTIAAHAIHREVYEIPATTQAALFPPLAGRRIAVGTTTVRTVEDFLARQAAPQPDAWIAEADIFIYPPRTFRGVDALITNFHQPRSTLLCLVSAFLTPGSVDGIAWLKAIYAEAIAREYRFFSYGDAMLIL